MTRSLKIILRPECVSLLIDKRLVPMTTRDGNINSVHLG